MLPQLDSVIKRAKQAGLKRILLSGVTPQGNELVLKLVKQHPEILRASFGCYPIDALGIESDGTGLPTHKGKIDIKKQCEWITKNLEHTTAIGEIGLDFYWADKQTTLEQQTKNFIQLINFAKSIKKPIVIHSRKAERECVDTLTTHIPNNEIFINNHCFCARKSVIKDAIKAGHFFSIPPNVIKSQQFQILADMVPLTQLLTETDAPWLSPNDKPNEPANVILTIKKIAEIKNLTETQVADQIWKNYCKVFGGE